MWAADEDEEGEEPADEGIEPVLGDDMDENDEGMADEDSGMEEDVESPGAMQAELDDLKAEEENSQAAKDKFLATSKTNRDSDVGSTLDSTTYDTDGPSNNYPSTSALTLTTPPPTTLQPHNSLSTVSTSQAIDDQQNQRATASPTLTTPLAAQKRTQRLCAKLHSLYGVPIEHVHRAASTNTTRYALRGDTAPIHPYARSKVYDLRQHTDQTFWGPFLNDGSQTVDWEKIEAIMIILNHSMKAFTQTHGIPDVASLLPQWDEPFEGAIPHSYVPKASQIPMQSSSIPSNLPKSPGLALESQDPYNITGTWTRVVCFLDYTELYDFNFASSYPPSTQPRPALDTEEAIRIITMRLRLTKVKPSKDGGLPVVHFKGGSSSYRPSFDPNANSEIRGMIYVEWSVRWIEGS